MTDSMGGAADRRRFCLLFFFCGGECNPISLPRAVGELKPELEAHLKQSITSTCHY